MTPPFFRTLIKTIKYVVIGLILLPHFNISFAAIRPAHQAKLNYTQVMFEYNEVIGSTHYIITVYPLDESGSREGKKFIKIKNTSLAYIISFPGFGKSYGWHYEAFKKNKSLFKSQEYNFQILSHYIVDQSLFRSKIDVSKKDAFSDDLIFLDYLGVAIDRKGQPVWYYPYQSEEGRSAPNFRNLRMTGDGTITFLDNTDCSEVDLDGNLVWKAPNDGKISGEAIEFYHHDFRKMDDGTYMTSSYKYEIEPNYYNNAITSKVRYNTLIQYDTAGNVLWYWNEKDHVSRDEIFRGHGSEAVQVEGTHLNGFDYDADDDALVLSFRNNSSILKIDKKTGVVIYDLGIYNLQSRKQKSDPWFRNQHGPVVLPGNQILIYNNNTPSDVTTWSFQNPRVLIVKEPQPGVDASKVWEYECKSERFPNGIIGKEGYATPLNNGNILVCMGGVNFAFEVTPAKEIVWQTSFEKYDDTTKSWTGFNNYRCNFTSSLYPKHFTLQFPGQKAGERKIKINNEGTDEDQYKIEAFLKENSTRVFEETITIKGRHSQIRDIPWYGKNPEENIMVLVTPVSGKTESKSLEFKKQVL